MSRTTFRKAINWLGILVIGHIASLIIFSLMLSGSVAEMSLYYPIRANRSVFVFNVVFDLVFAFMYFKLKTSFVDYQKSFKEIVRADGYSFAKYFKEEILKEQIMMSVVLALFQIPFVIFYAIWGFSLLYPILLEKFYIMNAGAYLVSNSAILGWLLNTLMFTFVFFAIRLFFFVIMKRELESK